MDLSSKKRNESSAQPQYRPSKIAQALSDACDSKAPVQAEVESLAEEKTRSDGLRESYPKANRSRGESDPIQPHVLVVDDDSGVRRSLARILSREGYSPITTGDGQAVVDLCVRMRPALIFLDISMPNFNGPQVLKALKTKMGEDYPPVVWITGSVAPENLKTMGGAVACVPKPLELAKISEIAKRYLPGK
ncbi:MAG: response regulator [Deltaproteobacteria bacterium]|nr:response regulator [Deltaproteobacteria bacterium]